MDKLQIKRLREGANLPRRATESSAGYDLCACLPEEGEITLAPGLTHIFPPPVQEVEELAATGRGEGRFGSTGKR